MGSGEQQNCRCGMVSVCDGGEVILCAGVFESPRILIASGLGLKSESAKVDVDVPPR